MTESAPAPLQDDAVLPAVLKAIRRLRSLTVADTAAHMHMSPRAYERFEAGETRLNLDYVRRFARITRSDYNAIVAAILIGRAEFAVHCTRNQLATILATGLHDLTRDVGADLDALSARDVLEAVGPMFDALARKARTARATLDDIAAAQARLDANRSPTEG